MTISGYNESMVDLSVIIISFNTREITAKSIDSLVTSLQSSRISYEIIVVDNASTDGSLDMLHSKPVRVLALPENLGFGKANNRGVAISQGKYILYLNSDVIIDHVDFADVLKYMDDNRDIGVLTVKVNLLKNGIDPASHRGFPTLWRSFTYFSGLEKTLGRFSAFKKLFGGYHLLQHDLQSVHEIDSPTGAFYLTRKEILDTVGGFDEKFFMYGEDLDLSFRIKEAGYKIMYFPKYMVTHLKHASGLRQETNTIRNKTKKHFYEAMRIFYDKHYARRYPPVVNGLVHMVIDLKKG